MHYEAYLTTSLPVLLPPCSHNFLNQSTLSTFYHKQCKMKEKCWFLALSTNCNLSICQSKCFSVFWSFENNRLFIWNIFMQVLLRPCVPMIHVAAKWMHAFNQDRVLVHSALQKRSGQGVRTHPPMVLSVIVRETKQLAFY